MVRPRLVLCNGISPSDVESLEGEHSILELNAHGDEGNVNIRITDVARKFGSTLSPRLLDLLEIASYVYTADCAVNRGSGFSDGGTAESWARTLKFVVPVSDTEFWGRSDVTKLLQKVLGFLSDDVYTFDFRPFERKQTAQGYLDFADYIESSFDHTNRVIMFSGGLDSLAGAIETASKGENLVLVSHRPSPILTHRQKDLYDALTAHVKVKSLFVPVWINKESHLGRESTQRTRSFLYAALGAVIAEAFKAGGVRFFENGVVSLNFPVADEVLRARASRTTHPLRT